jgi:hypothetical protein
MKRHKEPALPLPQFDYGLSLQTAVSWLGDRHVLAKPVPSRNVGRPAYFVERQRWDKALPSNSLRNRKH